MEDITYSSGRQVASGRIIAYPCYLAKIKWVHDGNVGTLIVYDSLSASGKVITEVANLATDEMHGYETFDRLDARYGVYVAITGGITGYWIEYYTKT